jgi:hypothetical protein
VYGDWSNTSVAIGLNKIVCGFVLISINLITLVAAL